MPIPKSSMPQLPNVVRVGLGNIQAQQFADHPDPNLLAAFVENGLSKKEREAVMDHLGMCADCRERLAIASAQLSNRSGAREADIEASHSCWQFLTLRLRFERREIGIPLAIGSAAALVVFALFAWQYRSGEHRNLAGGTRTDKKSSEQSNVLGLVESAKVHLNSLNLKPASLIASDQVAGASITIDGKPLGTVAPDGTFSVQVPAGEHRIRFGKDGNTSAEVRRFFDAGSIVHLARADAPLVPVKSTKETAKTTPDLPALSLISPNRLNEIPQQRANAARELAWEMTDKTSRRALEQFLLVYGEGSHAQEARDILSIPIRIRLEQHIHALSEGRGPTDTDAVLATLGLFESAYNVGDLSTIQSLWSGMPPKVVEDYRHVFQEAKSLTFRIRPEPTAPIVISGDTATVSCTRSLSVILKTGDHPSERIERVRVTLARMEDRWMIRSCDPI